ncbi:CLUMA_CG009617, isoform A [Clunio marinus]|uniref:CLUMA_CG009617, isoform A n=1 Tax=Clunio marinus TaxID=568069 RepID=A0A1J1I9E0_9DIPT|nr:CLUMA_CG009617, isoform A [Clunio marinus]
MDMSIERNSITEPVELLEKDNEISSKLETMTNQVEVVESTKSPDECLTNGKVLNGDGSDSGVETGASTVVNGVLQRALSSNSGGYASSSGGIEDNIGPVSCNSSMISCCSDTCEKTNNTIITQNGNDCCASEGGSESSSITGGPTVRKFNCTNKKKIAVKEVSLNKSPRKSNEMNPNIRKPTVSRSNTLPSKSVAPNLIVRERARSRDKTKPEPMKSLMTTSLTRSMSVKRPPKPDSFPTSIKDMSLSMSSPRVNLSRTPSLTRHRTPLSTPTLTDDGRWPSISNRNLRNIRGSSVTPESLIIRTRIGNIQLDNNKMTTSSTLDKYGTLPRRRKEKSVEDLTKTGSRSSSMTRDSLPNRMTSSMIKRLPSKDNVSLTPNKSLPYYPKIAKKPLVSKTKIFHETSVQTALTSKDLENALAGNVENMPRIDAVETVTKETQSDIRDKEMEKLQLQLDRMNADHTQLLNKFGEKSQVVAQLEQELLKEREEKLTVQKELQNNTERVMNMLETFQAGSVAEKDGGDSLLMLESQLALSGNVLEKQQEEIIKLQGICRAMQRDMEKSLRIQDNLIKQKNELEEESTELQDFLQAEKVAFMEALKEAESENKHNKIKIAQRESDLERQQEECRALVRICEQRRQEYLGMQTKYNALESRSKELLLSQSSAVSGANAALSGLGNRLETLVEQLITSYNISEHDLEDIVFFNDAYSNSNSESPEYESPSTSCEKSPTKGQSFLTAIINAIRNATTSTTKTSNEKKEMVEEDEDSTEMLDSETEPCLIMDNALEDVQLPDSHSQHSQNLVSSSQIMISQIEVPSEIFKTSLNDDDDGSLDNLSQAIANRRQIELQTGAMATRSALRQDQSNTSDDISCGQESVAEVPSIGDFCTAQALVDQVICVDNSVTKLLKVLRIIQMDNENCIQELVTDKNRIQVKKEETLDKVNEWEMINQKLKSELRESAQQLIATSNELMNSRAELQKHRQEIDRLNEDICNLSTLCSEKNANDTNKIDKDEILNALKTWQETGCTPDCDIVSNVVKACREIPLLKEKLREKERQLLEIANNASNSNDIMTSSWHQAMAEAKRQYEAIDSALETLNNIQNIVKDCPELAKMQRDLEETNFNTINSLPIAPVMLSNGNLMSADLNANETTINNDNAQIIDSTA